MEKKTFKSILYLITYFMLLTLIIVKIDLVGAMIKNGLLILTPLYIGVAIAFILNRPFNFFIVRYRKLLAGGKLTKMAKPFAMVTVYILFIGVIYGIVAFIIPQFSDSVKMLYTNLGEYSKNIEAYALRISEYLKIENMNLSNIGETLKKLPDAITKFATGLLPSLFNFTMSFVRVIVNLVIGFVLSIYLLTDKYRLKDQFSKLLQAYFSKKKAEKIINIAHLTNQTFSNFVAGQFIEAIILGSLCFLGMLVFGFDYPILISVIIGVTSLIPVVGSIIGLLPALFILLMIEPIQAVWFLVFLTLLQQFESNIIYPKVVGESIGLPAMWVLLAIIVGGGLFGILGMLLGVPTVSVLYQLLKRDVHSKIVEGPSA